MHKLLARLAVVSILALAAGSAWAQADQPPPAPEPAPPPSAAPAPAPGVPVTPAVDAEVPRRVRTPRGAASTPDGSPVVRAQAGNLGFFFKLGGLATLDHNNTNRIVNGLAFTDVGVKFVISEKLMLSAYFGTGLEYSKAETCPTSGACTSGDSTDMGIEGGVSLEYHFRIWRRISPFVGAGVGIGYINPSGDNNWNLGFGFGPFLGVEYYLGDRLSVTAEYMLNFEVGYQKTAAATVPTTTASTTSFAYRTLAGGALLITYYF